MVDRLMPCDVFEIFKSMFPSHKKDVIEWFPNGYRSIRLVLKDSRELIFTYDCEQNWMLETKMSFLNRLLRNGGVM